MKQIHIAIDGREANITNRVGSNVYAFEIISHIEKLLQNNPSVTVTVLLASEPISELPKERDRWKYVHFGPQKFWTQWALPIHLFQHQNKYDILFTPGHYAPRLSPVPYISSVMDTAYLDFPDHFTRSDTLKLTKWTKYSVKNAKKVIAISRYTKEQVIQKYAKHPHDVVIAYPSASVTHEKVTKTDLKKFYKKHTITEPYFLFVGTLQPRKNIEKLIEAFEIFNRMNAGRALRRKYKSVPLKRDNAKVKLVLAGKIGWLSEPITKRITQSPISEKIITTGFITQKEKQMLYSNAVASILIGLHEGFGIPPLESLYYNTVPIVSNTTSLPEVVGDAGLLADPQSPQMIADQMWQALTMTTKEKRKFKIAARKQIKKFNWQKSAEIVLNAVLQTATEKQ